MEKAIKYLKDSSKFLLFYIVAAIIIGKFYYLRAPYSIIPMIVYYIYLLFFYLLTLLIIPYTNIKWNINKIYLIILNLMLASIILIKIYFLIIHKKPIVFPL